jgi:hypothetical protein
MQIIIELPNGYTVEQAYEDAALATGWTPTIETKEVDTESTPPSLKTVTVANPVSAIDAGKIVWESVINERLQTTRLSAMKIRLETELQATLK